MSAEVLGQVERLAEALRRVDPALLSGADCAVLAERLAVAEKACAGLRTRAAVRAAECGAYRALGYAQPADWLAKVSGSSVGEAKAALETAASLPAVPEVQEALAEGALSPAQAREIARTEGERPGSAALLVDVARRRGLQAVRDEGRRMRLAAIDPEEPHRRQRAARSFRHWRDGEGMVCFRGALPPETGIPFVNRLGAECDRIRKAARRQGSTEPLEAHAADALVQLADGKGKVRGRSRSLTTRVAHRRRRCPERRRRPRGVRGQQEPLRWRSLLEKTSELPPPERCFRRLRPSGGAASDVFSRRTSHPTDAPVPTEARCRQEEWRVRRRLRPSLRAGVGSQKPRGQWRADVLRKPPAPRLPLPSGEDRARPAGRVAERKSAAVTDGFRNTC